MTQRYDSFLLLSGEGSYEPVVRSCGGDPGWLAGYLCPGMYRAFSKTGTVSGPGSVNQCLFQYTEPDICRQIGLFIVFCLTTSIE